MIDGDKMAVCNQCKQTLIEIDNHGERLTGCLTCNRWYTAEGKRKKLSEEDLRALYLLKHGGAK